MLKQIFFGLPLWVWLVVISIIMFSCYKTNDNSNLINKQSTNEKFSEISKPKVKVLNFNTSWCGWSRKFQPEWDDFSNRVKSLSGLAHVEALDIKCDNDDNESMCENYQIPGFPSVVIETEGKRIHYNGERTADALVKHLLQ